MSVLHDVLVIIVKIITENKLYVKNRATKQLTVSNCVRTACHGAR